MWAHRWKAPTIQLTGDNRPRWNKEVLGLVSFQLLSYISIRPWHLNERFTVLWDHYPTYGPDIEDDLDGYQRTKVRRIGMHQTFGGSDPKLLYITVLLGMTTGWIWNKFIVFCLRLRRTIPIIHIHPIPTSDQGGLGRGG